MGFIFVILVIYTFLYSYFESKNTNYFLKLPYRAKLEISEPILIKQWRCFKLYKLKSEFQNYSVLVFSRKK